MPVPPRRKAFGWGWLSAHAVLVAIIVLTYYGTWEVDGSADGVAEYGGTVPPLLPLGLPWNLPYFFHWYWAASRTEPMTSLYFLGPAVLNLVIHVGYRTRRWRQQHAMRPRAAPAATALA